MEYFFNEIEKGIESGLYQITLGMALCIPDICGALQSEDGRASARKYKEWYKKYVDNKIKMTADDCYYFRCSFLHQGSTKHEKSQYDRIIFVEPDTSIFHNNIINKALNIDIRIFCMDLVMSARQWFEDIKEDENFKRNYEKSFKRYPEGLAPYFIGIPVYS